MNMDDVNTAIFIEDKRKTYSLFMTNTLCSERVLEVKIHANYNNEERQTPITIFARRTMSDRTICLIYEDQKCLYFDDAPTCSYYQEGCPKCYYRNILNNIRSDLVAYFDEVRDIKCEPSEYQVMRDSYKEMRMTSTPLYHTLMGKLINEFSVSGTESDKYYGRQLCKTLIKYWKQICIQPGLSNKSRASYNDITIVTCN